MKSRISGYIVIDKIGGVFNFPHDWGKLNELPLDKVQMVITVEGNYAHSVRVPVWHENVPRDYDENGLIYGSYWSLEHVDTSQINKFIP